MSSTHPGFGYTLDAGRIILSQSTQLKDGPNGTSLLRAIQMSHFEPSEFIEALNSSQLADTLQIDGIVAPSEQKDLLLFDPTYEGKNWISIPTSVLVGVEYHGQSPDKVHSRVRITMRPSKDSDKLATALWKLLQTFIAPDNPVPECYYDFGARASVFCFDTRRNGQGFGAGNSENEALDEAIRVAVDVASAGVFSPRWRLTDHRVFRTRCRDL